MKKIYKLTLISSLITATLLSIVGCSQKESPSQDNPLKEELQAIEFDGVTADLTGLEEMYRKDIDINRDKIPDKVLVYGDNKLDGINRGKYIVFVNGKDDKTLTTVTCGMLDTNINNIQDIDGDGIYEILMNIHSGGTAGGGSYLLAYKDKTYKILEVTDANMPKLTTSFQSGYRVMVVDSKTGKTIYVNLTQDQRERYTEAGVFDRLGNPIPGGERNLNSGSKGISDQFLDIDKDGQVEYISQSVYSGTYNADSVINYIVVYTIKDGNLVYEDIICQANRFDYDENYKEPEAYATQTSTPSLKDNLTLIPWSGKTSSNGRIIYADEVQFVHPAGDYEYRIDGIDNNLASYPLSDKCTFELLNDACTEYYNVTFDQFLNFVEDCKIRYSDVPRARMFSATTSNGKITSLRFYFTP